MRAVKEKDLDFGLNKVAGEYLRKRREQLGMSMDDLAKRVRTTRPNIYKYETNKSRLKVDMFISICYALNLDPAVAYKDIIKILESKDL